jgi:hypothetical protein
MKVRHPAGLFIVLILCSILATSLHHHAVIKAPSDCAICKYADDLSFGDKVALYLLLIPFFVLISVSSESFRYIFRTITIAMVTRAPPVYTHIFLTGRSLKRRIQ